MSRRRLFRNGIYLLLLLFLLSWAFTEYKTDMEKRDLLSGYEKRTEKQEEKKDEKQKDEKQGESAKELSGFLGTTADQRREKQQDIHKEEIELSEAALTESEREEILPGDPAALARSFDFTGLQAMNPEIIGWLYVPGTQIDEPVCKGSDDAYYLTHDERRRENSLGAVFVPTETKETMEEAHILVYGHNMRSGRRFGELSHYRERGFWEAYRYVYLYTPKETACYRVYSVQQTRYDSFVYTIGYQKETELYRKWIEQTMKQAMYPTGIWPDGKQQILTLSTCVSRGYVSERLAVHCVKV